MPSARHCACGARPGVAFLHCFATRPRPCAPVPVALTQQATEALEPAEPLYELQRDEWEVDNYPGNGRNSVSDCSREQDFS
ncbi:hypothetical protein PR202_ga09863 [Eleusine coracana subsp. coracana]|uniref:Uncharacterized protein n=1 Tax=Eleusine coracana subsp. coracana TaxID=191504 RepID=A0AAV5C3U2_ELECO|nr:hypothetical protein PR202_ga09863 [Eleusine coracana subsp. coracana]